MSTVEGMTSNYDALWTLINSKGPGGDIDGRRTFGRVRKFLHMMSESNGVLVGRIIALDTINGLLLDIVHRLDPGIAGDEELRSAFAEADDELTVDTLTNWDNEILAPN